VTWDHFILNFWPIYSARSRLAPSAVFAEFLSQFRGSVTALEVRNVGVCDCTGQSMCCCTLRDGTFLVGTF
jgi:hypothetical protein